jgi:hypothetical protein
MRINFSRGKVIALPLTLLAAAALSVTLLSPGSAGAATKETSSTVAAGGQSGTAAQPPLTRAETDRAGAALVPATNAGMPPTAQVFFAVVNANGTLARGFGATSVTFLATGTYQVAFSHPVTGSALIATIGLSGSVGASPPGFITVVGRSGIPNAVFVQTYSSTGVLTNLGFHLTALS